MDEVIKMEINCSFEKDRGALGDNGTARGGKKCVLVPWVGSRGGNKKQDMYN